MPFRKIGKNPQQLPLLGVRFVNTCHLFLLSATYTISYAEPNFKIPLPHFYFTFTSRTAIYGLDGMSIVNSPLWRPAGVMVMFQMSMISDEDILKLKDLPIWFTHAKTDPVVVPDDFVVPTYERLAKVNPNAHFTYWDKVLDHTGTQKNADGTPFEYIGHWSWIPMLNDECVLDYDGKPVMTDGKETPILEWMAAQKKA